MAIIFCSQCGKKVTDRMTVCPHCQAVLIKKTETPKPVTKEEIQASLKGDVVNTAISLGITLLVAFIWSIFAVVIMGRYLGDFALAAVGYARAFFFTRGLLLLIVEAGILCAAQIFLKKHAVVHMAVTLVVSLLFGLIARAFLPTMLIKSGIVQAEMLAYSMMASAGFSFAFPMLLGSLTILAFGRKMKTGLMLQAGLGGAFLVLSVILCLLMTVLFGMGVNSLAAGNILTAFATLVLAALSSQGFRQLIRPKELA